MLLITDDTESQIVTALGVAAEQYAKNAQDLRDTVARDTALRWEHRAKPSLCGPLCDCKARRAEVYNALAAQFERQQGHAIQLMTDISRAGLTIPEDSAFEQIIENVVDAAVEIGRRHAANEDASGLSLDPPLATLRAAFARANGLARTTGNIVDRFFSVAGFSDLPTDRRSSLLRLLAEGAEEYAPGCGDVEHAPREDAEALADNLRSIADRLENKT